MSTGPAPSLLRISAQVSIASSDLWFRFSRSSGPGGQNVNKVNTRVTLYFDVGACVALNASQRSRIRHRLATRLTRDDILYVVSSKHRTQSANRRAAIERFVELLAGVLRPTKSRKKTAIPKATRRRRLEEKRRRSEVKRLRGKAPSAGGNCRDHAG